MAEIFKPHEIERKSMEIITSELGDRTWPEPTFSVVRRCIHTSADFDYADNLRFSDGAVELGVKLMRSGVNIVTDTMMAFSGINKNRLESFGGKAHCFIKDQDVIDEAKERANELERETMVQDFWNDAEKSSKKLQEIKQLKDKNESYEALVSRLDDTFTLCEMAIEAGDEDSVDEVVSETEFIENEAEKGEENSTSNAQNEQNCGIIKEKIFKNY